MNITLHDIIKMELDGTIESGNYCVRKLRVTYVPIGGTEATVVITLFADTVEALKV